MHSTCDFRPVNASAQIATNQKTNQTNITNSTPQKYSDIKPTNPVQDVMPFNHHGYTHTHVMEVSELRLAHKRPRQAELQATSDGGNEATADWIDCPSTELLDLQKQMHHIHNDLK